MDRVVEDRVQLHALSGEQVLLHAIADAGTASLVPGHVLEVARNAEPDVDHHARPVIQARSRDPEGPILFGEVRLGSGCAGADPRSDPIDLLPGEGLYAGLLRSVAAGQEEPGHRQYQDPAKASG